MQEPRCQAMSRRRALLERPDEENPAQTKTNDNLEHDKKCSHNNKQEVRRATLHTTPRALAFASGLGRPNSSPHTRALTISLPFRMLTLRANLPSNLC